MGAFLLTTDSGRLVVPNMLHFEGTETMLRRIFGSESECTFTLGFAGPTLYAATQRPNTSSAVQQTQMLTLAEACSSTANEGGQPSDDGRTLVGYERKDVAWSFANDGAHVIAQTQVATWANPVEWKHQGTWYQWTGTEWEEYKVREWYLDDQWEPLVGYPWQVPVIHPNFLLGPEFDPDDGYPEPDAYGAWVAENLHRLGGFPISQVFLFNGQDELVASAVLAAPMLWRPEGTITMQYVARLVGAPAGRPSVLDLEYV